MHYYRNRYYMPGNGIFTSRDAMWADIHRGWGYVGNSPTMYVDPYGLVGIGDIWDWLKRCFGEPPPGQQNYTPTYPGVGNMSDCQLYCYWKCAVENAVPVDWDGFANATTGLGPWSDVISKPWRWAIEEAIEDLGSKAAEGAALFWAHFYHISVRGLEYPLRSARFRWWVGTKTGKTAGKGVAHGLGLAAVGVIHAVETGICVADALKNAHIDENGACQCERRECE